MAWTIEFEPHALRELRKLGAQPAARIVRTLRTRVAIRADPRTLGEPLVGDWTGYWRYRIGDYRVIATFEDQHMIISVVRVAHRREVYRD